MLYVSASIKWDHLLVKMVVKVTKDVFGRWLKGVT